MLIQSRTPEFLAIPGIAQLQHDYRAVYHKSVCCRHIRRLLVENNKGIFLSRAVAVSQAQFGYRLCMRSSPWR